MSVRTVLYWFVCALLVSTVVEGAVKAKNYYDVLGVPRNATSSQIQKAYHKKVRELHPDRNPGNKTAADMFTEVQTAYQVLSDNEQRNAYDQGGAQGVQDLIQKKSGAATASPFDFLFGNMPRSNERPKGEPLEINLPLTLQELYEGVVEMADAYKVVRCSHCDGSGAESPGDYKKCTRCNGQGHTIETHQLGPGFVQRVQVPCPVCHGKGTVITRACHVCGGHGIHRGWDKVHIAVQSGSHYGDTVVIEEGGDEQADGATAPGDLIFRIVPAGEPCKFRRQEGTDHLHYDIEISLHDALFGFETRFSHLDGHEVVVSSHEVVQPEQVLTVRGEGMPVKGTIGREHGDLFVHIKVVLPDNLTEKQSKLLKEALTQ